MPDDIESAETFLRRIILCIHGCTINECAYECDTLPIGDGNIGPEDIKALQSRDAAIRAETIEAIRGALPCLHPAKCQRPNYLTCGNCRALDSIRSLAEQDSK